MRRRPPRPAPPMLDHPPECGKRHGAIQPRPGLHWADFVTDATPPFMAALYGLADLGVVAIMQCGDHDVYVHVADRARLAALLAQAEASA